MTPFKRIGDRERRSRAHYNTDPSTPGNHRRARIYNLWLDRAAQRTIWTNFWHIAPGIYRSNQRTFDATRHPHALTGT